MTSEPTLLEVLRSKTIVDCDTMDVEVPKLLGPFVDCTSNQAIAYFELQKPVHQKLIRESIEVSKNLAPGNPTVSPEELAVEIAMVKLQLEISKHITGLVHVQTNPYYSYNTNATVDNARRIVQIFKHLDPEFKSSRVCIKIPSTWEGIQACRTLESSGIFTLATTLFNIEQACLAGEAGCRYIAPYVNELKVHFEPGFVDHNKAHDLCIQAQRLYETHQIKTQVLPASLTSTAEIMALAGVHHITIAPLLLRQLAETPASSSKNSSIFDKAPLQSESQQFRSFKNAADFQIAFTRSDNGEGARKLIQAINIFCDMQDRLVEMMA